MLASPQNLALRTEDDPRWSAVCSRALEADDAFVYAVKTTGVYCRPSCAARRPKPENVVFHRRAEDAERAGFRPCKRCRPERASQPGRLRIVELCRLIDTSEEALTLEELARYAGLSRFHTQRLFKAATGLTPKQYASARRAERVRAALRNRSTVTEAIHEAGYTSTARFYEKATARLGMTPSEYRNGGPGLRICYAVGQCSLGSVLVATSERGVCAILLGDDPLELDRDLERRFPSARLVAGDAGLEALVKRVVDLVEDPTLAAKLPLDIRGTAFQERVWTWLTRIPPGETRTYSELAAALGEPKAARAVARACADNRLAVAIPCHRVVAKDGKLAGYRWGIERKRELLRREKNS